MPWGDGTQFLPLNKTLLKALGKQPGDEVEVTLEESIPPGSSQKVK
jgi:antitoxin component of MazEF toxin-antitoxin module